MFSPSSKPLPRRTSLVAEVTQWMRERLREGAWSGQLPGEMDLARELQVGRNTIRSSLAVLERDGHLLRRAGRRHEIVGKPGKLSAKKVKSAVLLLPVPLPSLSPSTLLWIDALRSRLQGAGWQVRFLVDGSPYRRSPAAALDLLQSTNAGAVWILYRSTAAMQRWFEKQKIRVVVAGSCHPGVRLPQVDTDFRATSRHAAGRLSALGHRHVAVLAPVDSLAGDEESLAGFHEGIGDAKVEILRCHRSASSVTSVMRGLLAGPDPPTALFVLKGSNAASALTFLLQQGVAVPARVSLISRDYEPFFQHLCPEPTCYRRRPEEFAKKIARHVAILGDGDLPGKPHQLLMPDFEPGETLGRKPVPKKDN